MNQDMRCPRDELLVALEADALSPDEEKELRAHLATCAVCREALEENRRAGEALRALPAAQPSQAARDRAYAAVLRAMEQPRAQSAQRISSSSKAPQAKLAPPARPANGVGFRVVFGSLAAAACLFLVAGVFFTSSQRADNAPSRSVAAAPPPADESRKMPARLADKPAAGSAAPEPTMAQETKPADNKAALTDMSAPGEKRGDAPAPAPEPDEKKQDALTQAQREVAPSKEPFAPGKELSVTGTDADATKRRAALAGRATDRGRLLEKARKQVFIDDFEKKLAEHAEQQKGGANSSGPGAGSGAQPRSVGVLKKDAKNEEAKPKDDAGATADDTKKPTESAAPATPKPAPPAEKPAPEKPAAPPAVRAGGKAAPSAPALYVFDDPGTPSRKLVVSGTDAYWVSAESLQGGVPAADATRTPLRRDAVESELLGRILDAELARTPQDAEWGRRVLALDGALEGDVKEAKKAAR